MARAFLNKMCNSALSDKSDCGGLGADYEVWAIMHFSVGLNVAFEQAIASE